MKFSESGIAWAKEKLGQLDGFKGFPPTDIALAAHAKALLRIAHPVIVAKRFQETMKAKEVRAHAEAAGDFSGRSAGPRYTPTEADWAEGFEVLEEVRIDGAAHRGRKLGSVNPVDWLIQYALDNSKYYPPPAELREIFSGETGPFRCADEGWGAGKEAAEAGV